MANFLPTAQKICWFSLNSLFNTTSGPSGDGSSEKKEQNHKSAENSATETGSVRRRYFWSLSFPKSSESSEPPVEHGELISDESQRMGVFKAGKNLKSRVPAAAAVRDSGEEKNTQRQNGGSAEERGGGEYCYNCKNVLVTSSQNETPGTTEESPHVCKRVLSYQDAPSYLRFNPHITGGYRGMLSPTECVKSLFWWTNETLNIWSHLLGWFFFVGLSIYDAMGLLDVPTVHPWDRVVFTLLLTCFQACMLLSSLYHIFCCHSEVFYRRWLSADLLGVSLTLLAIYISGIYYAFSCVPFWLNFYLVTVGAIFTTAMVMQILPMVSKKEMVTEERFHWRLMVFGGWAAYGVVPTFHWAYLHGGMASEAVALLLPRIFGMYVISGFAFLFYVARIPEKIWPGLVNYIGSSHQIWHVLIVASLYHWHNTGMIYLNFRATHPCSEEYAALFPAEVNILQYSSD